jgi:hypothetical protein
MVMPSKLGQNNVTSSTRQNSPTPDFVNVTNLLWRFLQTEVLCGVDADRQEITMFLIHHQGI